jgi:dTDP-4-amino-4,6-dideoxygalactose transaminase
MYTVLIDEQESHIDSRQLLRELAAKKIQARPLWQPIHRSPAHSLSGGSACPNSDAICGQAISLPCSVGLTPSDQSRVIEIITSLLGKPAGRGKVIQDDGSAPLSTPMAPHRH